ncbi:DIM/SIM/IMP family subclass B1 metallo-beta-lactamase [Exilibacterium tricleocarpae]|uniref:beta-lactamase n=1 Tax=Exilibacterium tricleocarpae TaxID=2591008 RepID=A0A545U8E4_9GAMM|nr:DIM/SIM/IMP family subclass B1 metallo-beta-lactamase [Exilibacterium tricleocarpae]TQV85744.1 DIM/SIM/IMP family subclass B1 metallo-beta-lactamase [Exilibacterium tricleocarpae]
MKTYLVIFSFFLIGSSFASDGIPDLIIEEIQKGVYLHKSFSHIDGFGLVSSNGVVVVDEGKAFIVDTPWSDRDTQKLVEWIAEKNYDLLGSISTHSHEDRTAGIKWLNANAIPTYASALTNSILHKQDKALAKYTLEDIESPIAGGLVEIFYPGGGHTIDNIVVWLPKSKVLVGGCLVRSLAAKGLGYTGEAHIGNWSKSVDKVQSRYADAKLVIPGHGKVGDTQLLLHTKTLAESAYNKLAEPTE